MVKPLGKGAIKAKLQLCIGLLVAFKLACQQVGVVAGVNVFSMTCALEGWLKKLEIMKTPALKPNVNLKQVNTVLGVL